MKKKHVDLIVWLMICLGGCSQSKTTEMSVKTADDIVQCLDASPSWAASYEYSVERDHIIEVCWKIRKCSDYDIIRNGIRKYMALQDKRGEYNIACMSKLYVLNRLVFNVPFDTPAAPPYFGGWHLPERAVMAWPLSLVDGQLRLSGSLKFYTGAEYDALGEFDYFQKTFGPRPLQSN